MLVKVPPTKRVFPAGIIWSTESFGAGFHGNGWPVETSSAARCGRDWPPIVVKLPPAYTTPVDAASAETAPLAEGFQARTDPVVGFSAAIFERATPLRDVNWPPT